MAERVDQLIPYGYAETPISTFHAFGDRVLREAALEVGLEPRVPRAHRSRSRSSSCASGSSRLPLDRFRPLGDPTRHLAALADAREPRQGRGRLAARSTARGPRRGCAAAAPTDARSDDEAETHLELAAFYEAHQRLLGRGRARRLRRPDPPHPRAAARAARASSRALRDRYRYVLVDEFQDTNHAQLEMLKLVAGGGRPNITVVGDDDQAIYRWRGAAAANLLAFRRLYPGRPRGGARRELSLDPGRSSTRRRGSSATTTRTGSR